MNVRVSVCVCDFDGWQSVCLCQREFIDGIVYVCDTQWQSINFFFVFDMIM